MAQQTPAQPGPPDAVDEKPPAPAAQLPESPADLAAIRAASDAFVDAFNKGDAKAVAALWTEDGDYIDESGNAFAGRDAIEKVYADFFADNPESRIRIAIDSLRLVSDSEAIEDGRTMVDPPSPGSPAIGKYTAAHVKVDVNGQDAGTGEQYYQHAATLAATGTQADAPPDAQWLPMGVFALSTTGQDISNVTIQLAVNKEGVIRGNYTDTATNQTQLIQGSVDKQTQRVAFSVSDSSSNLIETGLYNLTKDEAPCLLHFGKDRTEQWLLVRLKQPSDGNQE